MTILIRIPTLLKLSIVSACFLLFSSVSLAQIHRMAGKITAIDLEHRTVVVEVPIADNQTFTVAGPLTEDTILVRNAEWVELNDFEIGEKVLVRWHSTEEGHKIDRLTLR